MKAIPRVTPAAQDESFQSLAKLFGQIERRARLSGRADVLMALDRIPGAYLGPSNRVSDGAELIALGDSYQALMEIHALLESSTLESKQ